MERRRQFQNPGTIGGGEKEYGDGAKHDLHDGPVTRRRASVPQVQPKLWQGDRFPRRCDNGSRLPSAKRISATTACRPTALFGSKAGLSESDLLDARHGTATDEKINAALVFARKIVQDRGHVSDEDLEEVRRAGYTDGEIAEIVANVALSTFTNYFNQVADTEIDFPVAPSLAAV